MWQGAVIRGNYEKYCYAPSGQYHPTYTGHAIVLHCRYTRIYLVDACVRGCDANGIADEGVHDYWAVIAATNTRLRHCCLYVELVFLFLKST